MLSEEHNRRFCDEVERRLSRTKQSSCMEIVIELAEESGLDPGTAGRMLNSSLRQLLEVEARDLHFRAISQTKKLPLT